MHTARTDARTHGQTKRKDNIPAAHVGGGGIKTCEFASQLNSFIISAK